MCPATWLVPGELFSSFVPVAPFRRLGFLLYNRLKCSAAGGNVALEIPFLADAGSFLEAIFF